MIISSHDVSAKMETCKICFWRFVGVFLLLLFPGVEAFDAGDAIALVLGLVIGILGICACLGAYARKRAGNA